MPAECRVGAGIDEEGQPGVGEVLVQLPMRDAGLDGRIEIVDAHAQHLVHLRQVDAHAAVEGEHLPLERCAGAEGDDRHAALGRGPDDGADFVRGAAG